MMSLILRTLVLAFLLSVCGCWVRSLHPLHTEENNAYDPALIGEWVDSEDGDESWVFAPCGEGGYSLTITEEDATGEFEAHLVKVGERLFLDIVPDLSDVTQNELYELHVVSVHTLMWVRQIEPVLQMSLIEEDWLKRLLRRDPDIVSHEVIRGSPLLTASPRELEAFLITFATDEEAFDEPSELRRKEG